MHATLDWSHELLSETERVVRRRLAVFGGVFTLEAASAVAASADIAAQEGSPDVGRLHRRSTHPYICSSVLPRVSRTKIHTKGKENRAARA